MKNEQVDAWKDAGFRNGDLRTAYETTVDAYLRAKITAEAAARLTAATDDHTAKEKAYSDQRTALETATETAYTGNPSIWENAATAAEWPRNRCKRF